MRKRPQDGSDHHFSIAEPKPAPRSSEKTPMRPSFLRRPVLLARFSLLSLVLIMLLGLALGDILRNQIRDRALENAERSAERIASLGIQSHLSPHQLTSRMPGPERRTLDRAVSADIETGKLTSVRIWNRDAVIVYADDHDLIGRRFESDVGLLTALGGSTVSTVEQGPTYEHDRRGRSFSAS